MELNGARRIVRHTQRNATDKNKERKKENGHGRLLLLFLLSPEKNFADADASWIPYLLLVKHSCPFHLSTDRKIKRTTTTTTTTTTTIGALHDMCLTVIYNL